MENPQRKSFVHFSEREGGKNNLDRLEEKGHNEFVEDSIYCMRIPKTIFSVRWKRGCFRVRGWADMGDFIEPPVEVGIHGGP